jgi:hypothetical protein
MSRTSRGEGRSIKERRGKEGEKNTFELSRTTGGRKEGTELGRWLCLCLPFLANRGFGNRTSNYTLLASADSVHRFATHQSDSTTTPFALH